MEQKPLGKTTLKVKSAAIQIIGWVGGLFFAFCAFGSLATGEAMLALGFMLGVALGAYLILTAGELSLSDTEILYATRVAKFRMAWDEVKWVEMDASSTGLVFCGSTRDKRLAVYGPAYWSGPNKQAMAELLSRQLKERQIELKQTQRATYSLSKNTKIA